MNKRILAIVLIVVIGVGIGIGAWVFLSAPTAAFAYPGAPGSRPNVIKIGVAGDRGEITGDGAYQGAYFAAKEINEDGGVDVDGTPYYVGITMEDTDEGNPQLVTSRGVDAARRLIYGKEVDYALGGFRTEAVLAYIEEFMDAEMLFIGVGASTDELCQNVIDDYDTYKYFFRYQPINSTSLGGQIIATIIGFIMDMNATYPNEVVRTVGVLAEDLTWTAGMQAALPAALPAYTSGYIEVLPVVAYDITLSATDMNTYLQQFEDDGIDILIPVISAQGGILMMQQYAQNEYEYLIFGIDVQSQLDTYWDASNGAAAYEVIMQTLHDTPRTSTTLAFLADFREEFGMDPLYTAVGAYEAVIGIKNAIEGSDSLDTLDIIAEMETWTLDNAARPTGVAGQAAWWPSSHDLVAGYPYGYTLWTQWQPDGTKIVIPSYGLYPDSLATGTYTIPPWVATAWA